MGLPPGEGGAANGLRCCCWFMGLWTSDAGGLGCAMKGLLEELDAFGPAKGYAGLLEAMLMMEGAEGKRV